MQLQSERQFGWLVLKVQRAQTSQPFLSQYRIYFSATFLVFRTPPATFSHSPAEFRGEYLLALLSFSGVCKCPYFCHLLCSCWGYLDHVADNSYLHLFLYKDFRGRLGHLLLLYKLFRVFCFVTVVVLSDLIQRNEVWGMFNSISLYMSHNPSPILFGYRNLAFQSCTVFTHLHQEANDHNIGILK